MEEQVFQDVNEKPFQDQGKDSFWQSYVLITFRVTLLMYDPNKPPKHKVPQ